MRSPPQPMDVSTNGLSTGAPNAPDHNFMQEVKDELRASESLLNELRQPSPHCSWTGPAVIIALLIDIAVLFLVPGSFLAWVVAAFLLYSYSFVVLLLPTKKREARPIKSEPQEQKDVKAAAKTIYRTRKKLVSQLLLAMVFMNMGPLVLGLSIIFAITVSFAVMDGLTELLSPLMAAAIIFFSIVAVAFYIWVARIKPYSERFVSLFMGIKAGAKESFSKGWVSGLRFSLWLAVVMSAIGMGFVAGMILPGMFLNRVQLLLEPTFGMNLLTLFFMLATGYAVIRHFQSRRSRSMAIRLLEGRIDVMRRKVLAPLSDPSISSDGRRMRELRSSFDQARLFTVDRHDFNGWFPVFLVNPRLSLLLDPEVLESVDSVAMGPSL